MYVIGKLWKKRICPQTGGGGLNLVDMIKVGVFLRQRKSSKKKILIICMGEKWVIKDLCILDSKNKLQTISSIGVQDDWEQI